MDVLLELDYTDVRYDNELIQNNTIKRGKFTLDNIERQQAFAWGMSYEQIRVEYERSNPFDYQRAALDIGSWINGSIRAFVVVGAESDVTKILDPNLDESFWEAGFQYTPNQRLNFEAAWGDRFYGSSFRLDTEYRLKRGSMSLSYNEGPAAQGMVSGQQRPINDTDNLDGILFRPGRSDFFLSRRLDWSINIELAKSELNFRAFGERREQRSGGVARARGRWCPEVGVASHGLFRAMPRVPGQPVRPIEHAEERLGARAVGVNAFVREHRLEGRQGQGDCAAGGCTSEKCSTTEESTLHSEAPAIVRKPSERARLTSRSRKR